MGAPYPTASLCRGGGALLVCILAVSACGEDPRSDRDSAGSSDPTSTEIAHFPIELGDAPASGAATFDASTSEDGNGSLRIDAEQSGRLRLYALEGIDPRGGRLVYTGFLRSRDLDGAAFLELRCRPATGDASFVRGGPTGVKGTSDWTPQVAGFSDPALCHGPVGVELNVVIQGPGTVWIDALRLWTLPAD